MGEMERLRAGRKELSREAVHVDAVPGDGLGSPPVPR